MIYCVIPPELADELYEKLVEYYKTNPNVKVIIDRRAGKPTDKNASGSERASNRRRHRISGTFPNTDAH